MSDTFETNTSGYNIPGSTYTRKAVIELQSKKLAYEYVEKQFWNKFIGAPGSGAPIIKDTNLMKEAGDIIRIHMAKALDAAGRFGANELEGNEEAQDLAYKDIYVNSVRNAVKDEGKMSKQRSYFDMIEIARKGLQEWYAAFVDEGLFRTIYYGAPSHVHGTAATYAALGWNSSASKPPRYWYMANETDNPITYSATDATWVTNIAAGEALLVNGDSSKMSPAVIEGLQTKLTEAFIPKITMSGFDADYLMVIHPRQTAQLRQNETFFNALRTGMERGASNPIFSGNMGGRYVGIWDGIAIMECGRIHSGDPTAVAGETLIDGNLPNIRRAVVLGANAIAYAVAQEPKLIPKDDFDYFYKRGIAVEGIWGAGRTDYTLDATAAQTLYGQNVIVVSTYSPSTVIG